MRQLLSIVLALSPALAHNGAELFEKNCAGCHKPGSPSRAPLPESLRKLSRQAIAASLLTGKMLLQAASLSVEEREAIADYLAVNQSDQASGGRCASAMEPLKNLDGWQGWSIDVTNRRFQPAAGAGLDAAGVKSLKLQWAFGYPAAITAYGQPSLAGGAVFVGSDSGTVYALDARTGCTWWTFHAGATVRTAISLGPYGKDRHAAYFGDGHSTVYAVDAQSGALLWKKRVEEHALTGITGTPKLYQGRLYVPVSAGVEEFAATNPKYACCTARGSVVALDAETGRQIWKTYTISDPPGPTRMSKEGVQLMGPSGVSVWSSPTIDTRRKVLYVGTGNDHSEPETRYSDGVIALDLETGSMLWVKQLSADDRWNVACVNPDSANCPSKPGGDHDVGSSPILIESKGGKRILLVGQKSGVMSALDPDAKGNILWQTRVGKGGVLGGILWGSAADDQNVYVPLSDWDMMNPAAGGGMFALRAATGEKIWYTPPSKPACAGQSGCTPTQMAPATVIPGVVFSGGMDGHLRAYSTSDGAVIWDYDTVRDFETVNGVKARGGSLGSTGAIVSGGMLLVNSGYAQIGGMPGNVLLAFGAH